MTEEEIMQKMKEMIVKQVKSFTLCSGEKVTKYKTFKIECIDER